MKFLHLIWRNLLRRKLRTFLTLLCILVAFVLFGYLAAIRVAFSAGVEVAGVDRLVVRNKVSLIQPLPESYEDRIERIAGVDSAANATWFGGVYQDPKNFFAQLPVDPDEFLDMYPEYLLGEEEREAWRETRTGAVVGRVTADRFGWEVGDRIPLQATIYPKKDGGTTWEFDLVGIYEGREKGVDTSNFLFRHDYFSEARQTGSGLVGWYWVRVNDPEKAAETAKLIDEEFANSPYETTSEPEGAFVQGFANQIGNIAFMIQAILAAVFFTILLVAGNTMAQSVRERVGEIGVLKALGFTHRGVLALILSEAMVLAIAGGVLGLVAAYGLIGLGDPTNGSLPVFYFPARDIIVGCILIVFVGLVTGILPAMQAQRLRVADALRR